MKAVHLLACFLAFVSILGAQTALSSVEGQVVSGAGGAPVRRALVVLQRSAGGPAVFPGQPPRPPMQQPQMETTDDQGRFAFYDLEAGGYRITVQRQGILNQSGMPNPNMELWLGEGQQLTGYVIHATAQSVIAGRVLDEYGDPVMGAQVFAQRGGIGGARTNGSVQSNDLGEYRIAGLSGGDYVVGAAYQDRSRMMAPPSQQASSGQPALVYATTYHPGATVASEAEVVHVTDGAVVSGIDIKLAKVNGYSIRVTVDDPGAGANGPIAYPSLRPRDPSATPGAGYFGAQRQPDGSYVFTGVTPGSYIVTAQRGNSGTAGAMASASLPIDVRDRNLEGIVLQAKPNADLQGAVRFEQPGTCDATNMTVNLRPPGGVFYGAFPQPAQVGADLRFTLNGVSPGVYSVNVNGGMGRCYVKSLLYGGQPVPDAALTVGESGPLDLVLAPYNATLSVMVVDPDGNPVPRARLTLMPSDGSGQAVPGGISGPGGQMSFAALRPGDYKVYAFETAGVNMPSVLPNVDSLKPFEGRSKTVTVPENGRATVEVTAIPLSETGAATEPAQNGAKGSLAGKVVNAINGSPIAGATVTLRGQFSAGAPPQGTSAATDDQGRFTFPSLAPGSYSLMPVAPRFIRPANGASVNQERVIVGEGQQVSAYVVRMAPAGVIAGTVKDESGQPVLGAQVSAFRYRNDLPYRRLLAAGNARTDDLGQYRMATLAPGDYYVSVAPARAPRTNVVLADTADIPVAEPLEPSSGPTPVAASSAPETIAGPLPSEAESGYVRMWYPSAAQPSAATAVRLASGATVDNIDMTWGKTSVVRIRGKVTDSAGAVIVTPLVTLTPKNSDIPTASIVGVTVARDGSFEIASVPAGSYLLIARPGAATAGLTGPVVSAGGAAPVRLAVQEIDVKDSSIDGVKLVLTAGRMVKGTLKMEDGSPVPRNCCFSLLSMEGGAPSATIAIAADGTLTVNHVFPLTYTLGFQNLPANCYVKSIRYRGTDVSPTAFAFTGDGQLDVVLSGAAAGPLPVRIGSADSHGNFYFANLPPGDYRVLAWDNSAREASDPPQSLTPFARYAKTVTLGAGAHEKVQLAVAPSGR